MTSVADLFRRMRSGRSRRADGGAASHRPVQDGRDGGRARHHGEASSGAPGASRGEAEIRPGGSLTLVSGFLSVRPRPNSAIVSAANGALESLARALALELAPVRVNAVSPGVIDTPIRAAMPEEARAEMLAKTAARAAGRPRRHRRGHRPADPRASWPTALPPDRSSISTVARW